MNVLLSWLRFRFDHRWVPHHVSPYLDGELSQPERGRLERHVDDCPECRELLRALKALIVTLGMVRGEQDPPVAQAIFSSVRGRLEEPGRNDA
jgi:anti-sigma factor RsiW